MNIDKIENLHTALDHTYAYKTFKRVVRESGNVNFAPSDDSNWPKNALRARTLLAIASRQNRMKIINVPELPFFDEEGMYFRNVNFYFDEEDSTFIEFIIQKMNDWSHVFEYETAADDDAVRLEREQAWAKKNSAIVPTFIPHVKSDELIDDDASKPEDLEAVKAMIGYSNVDEIGWARTQGWLMIIDPKPEDAPLVAELIKPSFVYLDHSSRQPEDDTDTVPVSRAASIVERRRKERDRTNATISVSRSIITRK